MFFFINTVDFTLTLATTNKPFQVSETEI